MPPARKLFSAAEENYLTGDPGQRQRGDFERSEIRAESTLPARFRAYAAQEKGGLARKDFSTRCGNVALSW